MNWYSEYKASLKMVEVEEFFDLFFYRPLAFFLVKTIYSTSITPNQLTLVSIMVSIVAGFFYAAGTPTYLVYGALLFMLHLIIDCSDGQLARLKKNGTHIGRLFDGAGDYISTIAVFIGLGIGYPDHHFEQTFWWLLIALTLICNGIQSALVDYYCSRFLDYVLERKSTFEEDLEAFKEEYRAIKDQRGKWLDRFIIGAYLKYTAFQKRLTDEKKDEKLFKATPKAYYQKNKIAVRFWASIGPTAQVSALVICSLLNRFDIFFWLMLVGFNAMAVVMWLIQRSIDKGFKAT